MQQFNNLQAYLAFIDELCCLLHITLKKNTEPTYQNVKLTQHFSLISFFVKMNN